jgi:hypothetical protein
MKYLSEKIKITDDKAKYHYSDPSMYTCFKCKDKETCNCSYDMYNINDKCVIITIKNWKNK